MATVTRIGPADHGRPMTLERFEAGDYRRGYQYELIDGKLYVSHWPSVAHAIIESWLLAKFARYSSQHPEVINFFSSKARVFVPGRGRTTAPQPDLALYGDFPLHLPIQEIRWQDSSPFLVGEVMSLDDPAKDLVRNVELYEQVPTVKEYWILDIRNDPNRPTMLVFIRHGKTWGTRELAYGDSYTTRRLPGFELLIDPRR